MPRNTVLPSMTRRSYGIIRDGWESVIDPETGVVQRLLPDPAGFEITQFGASPLVSALKMLADDARDQDIVAVRDSVRRALRDTGTTPTSCHDVAAALATAFVGCRMEGGWFRGPCTPGAYGDALGPHSWIVTKSGTIIDAAAQQFGYYGILRIPYDDPRQTWYERGTPRIRDDGTWERGDYVPATHVVGAAPRTRAGHQILK
jgi:hypothetical protein